MVEFVCNADTPLPFLSDGIFNAGRVLVDNAINSEQLGSLSIGHENYLLNALRSHLAGSSLPLGDSHYADNGLNSSVLADDSINADRLTSDAISAFVLRDNLVNSDSFEDGTELNTAKFADNAVTSAKLADGAINSASWQMLR